MCTSATFIKGELKDYTNISEADSRYRNKIIGIELGLLKNIITVKVLQKNCLNCKYVLLQ